MFPQETSVLYRTFEGHWKESRDCAVTLQHKFVSQHKEDEICLEPSTPRVKACRHKIHNYSLDGVEGWGFTLFGCAFNDMAFKHVESGSIDTQQALADLQSAPEVFSTNFNDDGQRSIQQRSADIRHPGVRVRFAAPGSTDRLIAEASCQEGQEENTRHLTKLVRTLCNGTLLLCAQWAPTHVLAMVQALRDVWGKGGTASFAHGSVAVAFKPGATVHRDAHDGAMAIFLVLGGPCDIYFPEAGIIVELNDGDILTFDSTKMWHCCCGAPANVVGSVPDCVCVSMYVNKGQMDELQAAREQTRGPALSQTEVASLVPIERKRHHNKQRQHAVLKKLKLA